MQQYVLTIIGDDKTGLVDRLAEVVKSHDGSWLESRMANLAGKFSGIVLVSVAENRSEDFETAVSELKEFGLSVRATSVASAKPNTRHTRVINLVANDRPGILSELTAALARIEVNVEELTTDCKPAPMSGELLFHCKAHVSAPDKLSDGALRQTLEAMADDLMVEID